MTIRAQIRVALPLLIVSLLFGAAAAMAQSTSSDETATHPEASMHVQYLEIVTSDVDATIEALAKAHGVTFGDPVPGFGNARTAVLDNGGQIGVRAPLAEHEQPVVRPYLLVDDIEAALGAVESAGAQIAMAATEIPGSGRFAVYILGGIQHGLWQLDPAD